MYIFSIQFVFSCLTLSPHCWTHLTAFLIFSQEISGLKGNIKQHKISIFSLNRVVVVVAGKIFVFFALIVFFIGTYGNLGTYSQCNEYCWCPVSTLYNVNGMFQSTFGCEMIWWTIFHANDCWCWSDWSLCFRLFFLCREEKRRGEKRCRAHISPQLTVQREMH